MSKHKPEEYAFLCAVVRAKETKLLSENDLAKLLDLKQGKQMEAMLTEFGYGDGKTSLADHYEGVLEEELNQVYAEIFSQAVDKSELELFRLPNDYHNVKVLLKAEFLGIDPKPYLVGSGLIEANRLAELVRERNGIFLESEMYHAIEDASEMFSKGRDPQEIDLILDRACYKQMDRLARETENDFIMGYVKLAIDLLNINTFVRLRRIGKPWTFFQKVFLQGGDIDERVFTGHYEEGYQQFADRMAPYGFRKIFAEGATQVAATGKYTLLEKLCDDAQMAYAKDAKYVSMGVEPIVGFLIAKEREVKNLRMLLAGKQAGVSPEVLAERLRETYV